MPRNRLLTQELYAWIWARENALVWTDTAERIMRRAMDSYRWEQKHKDIWERRFMYVV